MNDIDIPIKFNMDTKPWKVTSEWLLNKKVIFDLFWKELFKDQRIDTGQYT